MHLRDIFIPKQILTERASDDFIIRIAHACSDVFSKKIEDMQRKPKSPADLPLIKILGDVFPEEKAEELDRWQDRYLALSGVKIRFSSENKDNSGYYNPSNEEIVICVPKFRWEWFVGNWGRWNSGGNCGLAHRLMDFLRDTLVHELRHAYDACISDLECSGNPMFMSGRKDREALELKQKANRTKSKEDIEAAIEAYRISPVEVSARYTQALSKMQDPRYKTLSFQEWSDQFIKALRWYELLSPNVQKKLKSRMYQAWARTRDIPR